MPAGRPTESNNVYLSPETKRIIDNLKKRMDKLMRPLIKKTKEVLRGIDNG